MKATRKGTRTDGDPQSRLTPNKNDVHRLILKDNSRIFVDSSGRMYGIQSPNHYLHEGMKNSGEIDDDTRFLMWVALPTHMRKEEIHVEFPPKDSVIELSMLNTGDVAGSYSVNGYPDRLMTKSNMHTTAVVLERLVG